MRCRGLILFCEDPKAQAAWYRDVLGLQPNEEQPFPANRFVRFSTEGGANLRLHSGTKPNGGRQKITFDTESVERLVERLKASGRRVRKLEPSETMVFESGSPHSDR